MGAKLSQVRLDRRLALTGGTILYRFIERRSVPLMVLAALASLALRLRGLGHADGGYDEGVYLQTLMALASGHELYRATFHSQPPAFILGVYPFFLLCGRNLWAARFGVAVLSLAALPAAALLGNVVGGRVAAVMGLALAAFDPLYLAQSRTLDAEAPQIAFAFVAVAIALHAARRPESRAAPVLALFAGAAATVATLCKLTGVAAFVPLLVILAGAAVERPPRRAIALCALAGLVGIAAALAAFGLPYRDDLRPLWRQVVEMHLVARRLFHDGPADHAGTILSFLAAAPVSYAAFLGAAVGIVRRDPLVLPLAAWFVASSALLVDQTPLFAHHLVTLEPSLLALATLGFSRHRPGVAPRRAMAPLLAMIVSVAVLASDAAVGTLSYSGGLIRARIAGVSNLALARAIARTIDGRSLIITDCPLAAALAPRRTPARARRYVVRPDQSPAISPPLISSRPPRVRMSRWCCSAADSSMLPNSAPFRLWVSQHFRLLRAGESARMWIRPAAAAAAPPG